MASPPGSARRDSSGGPCGGLADLGGSVRTLAGMAQFWEEGRKWHGHCGVRGTSLPRPRSGQRGEPEPGVRAAASVAGVCLAVWLTPSTGMLATLVLKRACPEETCLLPGPTNSCACSGPAEMRCPQLTSQGPGVSWRLASRGHGAAGTQRPGLSGPTSSALHFLSLPSLPPLPLGLVCGPMRPASSQLPRCSPSSRFPKKGTPGQPRAYTDP